MCDFLKKLCARFCADSQLATQQMSGQPGETFAKIDDVAKQMNARLASSRPKTGCRHRLVNLLAVLLLIAVGSALWCAAEHLCGFVSDTLLKVSERGVMLLPTSVVIVIIVTIALLFLAIVVAVLTFAWKFYTHVDAAIAKDEARKIKEFEVYEQKLYAYYDKTLEKIWEAAYPKPQPKPEPEPKPEAPQQPQQPVAGKTIKAQVDIKVL